MHNDLIYDVGMNNGDDTAYYLARGFRVVAVEADPTLAEAAHRRFAAEIAAGRLKVLNLAVGPEDATAQFWVCPQNSVWNSFDRQYAARCGLPHHAIDVPVRRFAGVMKEHGVPYYLKIDIEGYDHYCLTAIDPAEAPRFVSFEITNIKDLGTLESRGYNAFKCISQRCFRPLAPGRARGSTTHLPPEPLLKRARKVASRSAALRAMVRPLKAALGRSGPASGGESATGTDAHAGAPKVSSLQWNGGSWEFPFGSSGPFGDDLPGVWQTADEVGYQWLDFWLNTGRFAPVGDRDWFDVHATTLPADRAPKIEVPEF
jgi:FkbM family methyltransferase